jgi:hypothetical protein
VSNASWIEVSNSIEMGAEFVHGSTTVLNSLLLFQIMSWRLRKYSLALRGTEGQTPSLLRRGFMVFIT